jgi:ferric-dicitrate binding protein FerR (iron transport regulator)
VYQNTDFILQQEDQKVSATENNKSFKQIQITLSDGSQHRINKKSTINLEDKSGRLVASKTDDILYFETSLTKFEDTSTIKIDIPYGQKLKLKLSDGTLVWLNSGTRFNFPQQFSSSSINREVNIVGEAYFEVSENKQKPFIVYTPSMHVKVLGTHFNISSYITDSRSKTTLIKGKVEVYNNLQINIPLELKPNQQVIFEKTSKTFQKSTVEANSFNSWIDNTLIAEGISFHELMKKLEYKYNVTITNELEGLWSHTYRGEYKDESLAEVLETIALSTQFKFAIEGKHVKIFNNNQMNKQRSTSS